MARFYRDAYGVPHLRASSLPDLARAQGRVTAADRTWQLEWARRRALGTTAEVVGEAGLEWDVFARRAMLVDTAKRAHAVLGGETRAFLAAYVDGVNQGLDPDATELRHLGVVPGPWPEWMPLAAFGAQQVLFAGLGGILWARLAHDALGGDAALLSHEGPLAAGSNAWAVGPERTASGRPLVGGDPHRVVEAPGVYQQVRLACEDPDDPDDACDVVGFAFPGVPGVQHFAHAGDVAWAITNGMADYQDVVEVAPDAPILQRRTETVRVRDGEDVDVEVRRVDGGVVFEGGLALRDAGTELGDLGFEALLPLLRARTADDVDRALDHWVVPVNNAVVADVHGTVRYRVAGRVPTRDAAGEWTGWLEQLPRTEVPPDGQVVTANERRGPESDAVGSTFAPPYRAHRLRGLLDGRTDLTPADFAAMHADTRLATVAPLADLVPGAFDDFDGRMDAGSTRAARFAAWRSALVRRLVAHPALAPLLDPPPQHRHSWIFAPWLDATTRVAQSLPSLAAAGTPFGIDLAALASEALADTDTAGHPSTWGETHVAAPLHAFDAMGAPGGLEAPPLPHPSLSGDSDCVCATASTPGRTDACSRGPVARYVWDLADRQAGGWVVPLGAHGDPRSPHHHDQLAHWAAAELVPIVTDWDRLTEET